MNPKLTILAVALSILAGCSNTTVTTSNGPLAIKNVKFATSKDPSSARTNATFKAGESAFILFDVTDAKKDSAGKVHVQQDLVVKQPGGKVIFERKNLVDFNEDAKGGTTINLNNSLDLPADFPGGNYSVTMTVHDVVAGNSTTATASHSLQVEAASSTSPTLSKTPNRGSHEHPRNLSH